jgi:phospholipid/cholesterol/gamma-HCH transport system substrate-binding protein
VSRRTLINLVFFAGVSVLMLFWAVNNLVTIPALTHPYTLHGEFEAASGVHANSEVAYLGVHYGVVTKVAAHPGGVRMTMDIDHGKQIPAGSIAQIFRKSPIGEPYISFSPPEGYHGNHGPYMAAGATVPRDHTTVPLEFSDLLRSASRLLNGIDPDKAGSLVHELSLALDGRAQSLRDLSAASDKLTSEFAARTDQLDRLATNNTDLTHVVAEHRLSLGQSLTNLSQLADSLKNVSGPTATLLDQGSQLLGTTADLVADEKANLDCLLHDLTPVLDATSTPSRIEGLRTLLERGPQAWSFVAADRDQEADGLWVRVNLIVQPNDPAQQYVPPKPLPAVPAVPACASDLEPMPNPSHKTFSGAELGAAGPAAPTGPGAARPGSGSPSPDTMPAASSRILGVLVALLLLMTAGTFRWVRKRSGDQEESHVE